ncbi:MAG: type II secretion system F family protein [Lachnospiraceae bacterium]|nr:type II secretion system F family protein [Lachnospiraceae bacterium]MBR5067685.1 type II secretion system F family protein [Lachnospiraceae bacterium]MBR5917313.1 type II secretion system F family protein [Lachnospiraceae bacterium]
MGRKNSGHKSINKKNLKTAGIVILLGSILLILLLYKNRGETSDSNVLIREENGKKQSIKLVAESEYGKEDIEIELLSRTYSEEEIENIKEKFLDELKLSVLSGNSSFEEIYDDLSFPDAIEGYPFAIGYRVRPRGIVDSSGAIINDIDEATPIELEITYSLEDFEEKETIEGIILPQTKSDEEEFTKKLKKYLDSENKNNRTSKTVILPTQINGVNIKWSKKKSSKVPAIIVLTVVCAGFVLFKDRILSGENEKKRREKIILEYPDFAVKYALLNEAGLTHRQIVDRLASEFDKKKDSPIYEEIYKVSLDVKGGLPLTDALESMSKNCGVREITFFVGLINRNIKKGGREISAELRKAADESSSEKREKIRRKAETAGTKLLLPMVFLLIIVFALIMIPAFDSFSF